MDGFKGGEWMDEWMVGFLDEKLLNAGWMAS